MKDIIAYPDFNYSYNASKLLQTQDEDIDALLKYYNLTKKDLEEMTKTIRDWYDKQPHLPKGQLHDRMIFSHLYTRAFSVEQAKTHIDNYFEARHRMPDILCGYEPLSNNMNKYLKQGYWILSPKKTKDNHRIVMLRLIDPKDLVVVDLVRIAFLFREYRLLNETAVAENWIFDFSNSTVNCALQLTPMLMSKVYYHITACYAPKLKGLHFINVPPYAMSILNLFKKTIKPKHAERVHLHESMESIFDIYSRDIFPKDLGGTGDFTTEEIAENWYETVQSDSWRNYMSHQDKHFYTDESKRTTPSKIGDALGIQGSFRTLNLD